MLYWETTTLVGWEGQEYRWRRENGTGPLQPALSLFLLPSLCLTLPPHQWFVLYTYIAHRKTRRSNRSRQTIHSGDSCHPSETLNHQTNHTGNHGPRRIMGTHGPRGARRPSRKRTTRIKDNEGQRLSVRTTNHPHTHTQTGHNTEAT